MQLKEVIVLKSQKNVYQIEEDDGEFIYGLNKINKHSINLQFRSRACSRRLALHPINKLRWEFSVLTFLIQRKYGLN